MFGKVLIGALVLMIQRLKSRRYGWLNFGSFENFGDVAPEKPILKSCGLRALGFRNSENLALLLRSHRLKS